RMGNGVLGSGVRETGDGNLETGTGVSADALIGAAAPTRPPTPEIILNLWNEITRPPIPRALKLTDDRQRKIRSRLRKVPSLAEWRQAFERVQASSWCRGEGTRRNGQSPWVADFDWVIKSDTVIQKLL